MRHHDVADTPFHGSLDEPEDLVSPQVTGAEDEAVTGDDVEDLVGLGQQGASIVDDWNRLARQARLAKGEFERNPHRDLLVHACLQHLVLFVDRRDGRKPNDARTLPRRDLHSERVEPADGTIQRDRSEHRDAGNSGGDDLCSLCGRGVVGLEAKSGLPGLETALGQLDVGDPTGDEVRRDVDVVVDGTANQRTSVLAWCRVAVARSDQCDTIPPSTTIVCPVMNDAASLARNTARLPTSAPVPRRFRL
jgi:hypothetical protein